MQRSGKWNFFSPQAKTYFCFLLLLPYLLCFAYMFVSLIDSFAVGHTARIALRNPVCSMYVCCGLYCFPVTSMQIAFLRSETPLCRAEELSVLYVSSINWNFSLRENILPSYFYPSVEIPNPRALNDNNLVDRFKKNKQFY